MTTGARRNSGLTLLELLTVVMIFSLMLALGVVLMRDANKDLGVSASVAHVAGLLRLAQQHARTTTSPAWVVLDTKENQAYALLKETVGEWHLEDTSGFGSTAQVTGASRVPGRVGQGLLFQGSGVVRCGPVPLYSPDQGVAVELWFQRRPGRARGALAKIGDQVELAHEANGQITGRVGGLRVDSGSVRLPPDAWCYIQLLYSGRDLRLFLNRTPCGLTAGTTSWTPSEFQIGDSRSGASGVVDEVRVSLITAQDRYTLPAECQFDVDPPFQIPADGKIVLGFDGEGRFEPPPAPPFKFFVKSSADRRPIEILLSGAVRR